MIIKSVKLTAHTDEVDRRVQEAIARALEPIRYTKIGASSNQTFFKPDLGKEYWDDERKRNE